MKFELPGRIAPKYNSDYGDNYIAAKYCGFLSVPKPIKGEWQHGWIIPERNINPEFVIGSDGLSHTRKDKTYLVARTDQEKYLKEQGFTNTVAIGLPIIYVQKPAIERVKGSLLVMPVHSLTDTQEKWNDEEYASYIESIADKFSEVVLCVHKSCFEKGNWIPAFRKRNIEVVLGADPDDSNTYNRLAALFQRFDFVTSNELGSHIAYAAYFGARTSIAGPKPKFERRDFEKTIFYRNAPDVLDIVETWYKEGFYKKTFPFLYKEPNHAGELISWAEFQLGQPEKKSPDELRSILGWTAYERMIFNGKKIVHEILGK